MTPRREAQRSGQQQVSGGLIERDGELSELRERITAARDGRGSSIVIEGSEGVGKSALLEAARAVAGSTSLTWLSTRASEFEQGFPWGVVRGLFEPALPGQAREREALMEGAARLADVPLGSSAEPPRSPPSPAEALGSALHGLYWLTANLAARGPLVLAIDDAHWADTPSLRWIEYMLARIEDLPVTLVASLNPVGRDSDVDLLTTLAHQATVVLRPAALSPDGTTRVVRDRLAADSTDNLERACHAATSGNPFLVHAVLDELEDSGMPPRRRITAQVADMEPAAVARAVSLRLARLPPDACGLACAVALWAGRPTLHQAAELVGLSEPDAVIAADALATAGLIAPDEPLRFVEPIVRTSVYRSLPPHRRSVWHARAAELLEDANAPIDQIAAHLLAVEAKGDQLLVDLLCDAGAQALARGAPESAVSHLHRALAEPPDAGRRPRVFRLLAHAELSLQRPEAIDHLYAALEDTMDAGKRGRIARELAIPLVHGGRVHQAVAVLERALADLGGSDADLAVELEAHAVNAGRLHPALREQALARGARLRAARLTGKSFGERTALAAVAGEGDALTTSAGEAVACASLALAGGQHLREAGAESPSYWYAVSGLILADAYGAAREAVAAGLDDARRNGSMLGSALAYCFRSLLEYRLGHLPEAEADALQAIEIAPTAHSAPKIYALAFLIDVLLDRDALEEAQTAVKDAGVPETGPPLLPFLVFQQNRGRLLMRLGKTSAGLEEVESTAHWFERGRFGPCLWPWRSIYALSLAQAGDGERAVELAREEFKLADAFGAPRARGVSLRALGVVQGGDAGTATLRDAVKVLADTPSALEHARALIDLGSLLRRGGRRTEALEPLREGLDIAHRCAATGLAESARAEMVSAGARPRRDAARGRDALTPSELRVAHLAAEGLTNREIAQALFVSLRTVETHLTHAYQKLSIDSRETLASRLGEEQSVDR